MAQGRGAGPAPGADSGRAATTSSQGEGQASPSGGRAGDARREVVSESWQRSLAAHVDPEHGRPWHAYERREVDDLREGHPLSAVLPLLRDTLVAIADQAHHMMIVTDAHGHILWRWSWRPRGSPRTT